MSIPIHVDGEARTSKVRHPILTVDVPVRLPGMVEGVVSGAHGMVAQAYLLPRHLDVVQLELRLE